VPVSAADTVNLWVLVFSLPPTLICACALHAPRRLACSHPLRCLPPRERGGYRSVDGAGAPPTISKLPRLTSMAKSDAFVTETLAAVTAPPPVIESVRGYCHRESRAEKAVVSPGRADAVYPDHASRVLEHGDATVGVADVSAIRDRKRPLPLTADIEEPLLINVEPAPSTVTALASRYRCRWWCCGARQNR